MLEFLWSHLGIIATASGAIFLAFLTPLGSRTIERWFSKRPAFSIKSSVLDSSLILIVGPANKSARKRAPLNIRIRGMNITHASSIEGSKSELQWRIDLSKIDRIREVLEPGNDYELQFFFDADSPSEKTTIRFIGDASQSSESPLPVKRYPKTMAELITQITSQSSFHCNFDGDERLLSKAFPATGPNSFWRNVHDGKELVLHDLAGVEISGTEFLAEPRYSWVIQFRDSTNLAIRDLTIGHTDAGFCRGGVLRFENCTNVTIDGCDLFGCGTYGIELSNCQNVEIRNVTIRECTYGAVILSCVSNLSFRNCRFHKNLGFDLFEIRAPIQGISITNCSFTRNEIDGAAFFFTDPETGHFGLFINECTFSENTLAEISNHPRAVSEHFNAFGNNVLRDTPWASSRRQTLLPEQLGE